MKALWQKDRPWRLGFLVAGAIALAAGVAERSFVDVFLVPKGQHEGLYYVAWIAGLLLGAVAACYDELLGTREFLQQRPVALARLATARLLSCGAVLLAWALLAPALAWLGFALFDRDFVFGYCNGLLELQGTGVVACSACAIGCFAGALPAPWWLRLAVAAALFLGTFQAIDDITFRDDRVTNALVFVGGHMLLAGGLFAAVRTAMLGSFDADRPWSHRLRAVVAVPATLGLSLLFLMWCTEAESQAVHRLHNTYPHPVVHDGHVVLVSDEPLPGRKHIVDADHELTGRVALDLQWLRFHLPAFPGGFRGLDRPRWSDGSQTTWTGTYGDAFGARILLASDGATWLWLPPAGSLQRAGKGEDRQLFAPGSTLRRLDNGKSVCVVVVDAASDELWQFNAAKLHFVPVRLPDGDRFVRLVAPHDRAVAPLVAAVQATLGHAEVDLVQGERSLYAFEAGVWRAVAATSAMAVEAESPCKTVGLDPLNPVIEVAAAGGVAAFHHDYAPRMAWERVHAGTAMLWSLLRAPLVQVIVHAVGDARNETTWLVDPLVVAGRRLWLVLACIGFALLASWRVHRRLRALSAPIGTVWFWTAATLLLGAPAALACLVFERPRAYAQRALAEPFAVPRIFTPVSHEEVVA
ncbi:MAG: hypothetical protein ABIP94_20315 [Planctomycetota bacterium]